MIYAHMSNYRTNNVRMMNTCQKILSNTQAIYQKMMTTTLPCTPARVENSTGTAREAGVTRTNARLRKNSAIPAAVRPAPYRQAASTVVDTDPGAGDPEQIQSDNEKS
jgi:hypothetical protein